MPRRTKGGWKIGSGFLLRRATRGIPNGRARARVYPRNPSFRVGVHLIYTPADEFVVFLFREISSLEKMPPLLLQPPCLTRCFDVDEVLVNVLSSRFSFFFFFPRLVYVLYFKKS